MATVAKRIESSMLSYQVRWASSWGLEAVCVAAKEHRQAR